MNELKEIRLDEVSLVDAGANPEAEIILYKRKEEKSVEEITKTEEVAEEVAKVAEVEKSEKPQVDAVTVDEAQIGKLATTLENLTKRLNEHIEKAEDAEFAKIAAKYEILDEDPKEIAKMLKAAKSASPEMYDRAIRVLDGAYEAVKKAGTFEEIGKSGYAYGESLTQVEKVAKAIQKEEPKLTWRQALDKAFQAHPELQQI